jgi:hypothetical protein
MDSDIGTPASESCAGEVGWSKKSPADAGLAGVVTVLVTVGRRRAGAGHVTSVAASGQIFFSMSKLRLGASLIGAGLAGAAGLAYSSHPLAG